MMIAKDSVTFKGGFNGLHLYIPHEMVFDDIIDHLQKLNQSSSFYRGSKVIGMIGPPLSYREKADIEAYLVSQLGVKVLSLEEPSRDQSAKKTEKPIIREVIKTVVEPCDCPSAHSDTKYVKGTVRSGQSVEHVGHVVIIGDVNPGAEVIAEGNVIIFGKLRGFVHAGSGGDDEAWIVANQMEPTQIRISKYILVAEDENINKSLKYPEKAQVINGEIKVSRVE